MNLPLMNLLKLRRFPILDQLHLEERLLRTSSDNWCIVNDGTIHPTIVMGISGKASELLDVNSVLCDQIPVIRRFTGGGTVIVDDGTVFVTFICNKDAVPGLQPYPRPIMAWSSLIYDQVFKGVGNFRLRENVADISADMVVDYVFGDRKFGGNAQSITKGRWIHHTSFLWDYEVKNMSYLKVPTRAPKYRVARDHLEFICHMKDYIPRSAFIDGTVKATADHFTVRTIPMEEMESAGADFIPSSRILMREELEDAAAPQEKLEPFLSKYPPCVKKMTSKLLVLHFLLCEEHATDFFQLTLIALLFNLLASRDPVLSSLLWCREMGEAALEHPNYELIHKPNGYEIRRYVSSVWMTTLPIQNISFTDASDNGFSQLFNYIQGDNNKKLKIEMTAPVLTQVTPSNGPFCKSTFIISFYVPKANQANTPSANGLHVQTWKNQYVAAHRFGGFASDSNIVLEAACHGPINNLTP
ncbi:Inactive lipoate--protein ligase 2-like protein [Drosera capensis]